VGVACLWVRLDPSQEWLADVRVAQPLKMWQWQLQHSKDVVSQAEAVAGLAALRPTHDGVVDALAAALRRPGLFCRVRADAALALGATAGEATYMRGATALIDYWK
jgi:transcription initiation factor TFIID subunit 2